MELNEIIAANIAALRKTKELTQGELGDALGYTFQAVSRWENAKSLPSAVMLKTIADYFEVPIEYMYMSHNEIKDEARDERIRKREIIYRIALFASLAFCVFGMIGIVIGCIPERGISGLFWICFALCVVAVVIAYLFPLRKIRLLTESLSLWSVANAIYYQFDNKMYMIYFYAVFGQIFLILLHMLTSHHPAQEKARKGA